MRPLFLLLFFCAFSISVFSQDDYLIYGVVKDSETFKKMGGVDVTVLKNKQEYDNITVSNSGKYEFYLPLGENYEILFTRGGYVTKKVSLITSNIPVEDRKGGFETNLDMTLFEYVEGFDTSILDQPIGKADFNPIKNAMEFDFDYTERIQRQIDAEFDRLDGLADQMEKLKEDFDKLILEGDKAMDATKFDNAISKYGDALDIFPDNQMAKDKLAAAQAAYDAANAAAAEEQKYQKLIADGQKNIDKEKYEDARKNFQDASAMKPAEKLPKDKLKEIDDILANLGKREEYKSLVAEGDDLFGTENFALSIEKYESALDLFNKENYPRDQIKLAQARIDELLEAARLAAELEQKYKELITLADRNFEDKNYVNSRKAYSDALALKSTEKHPKNRIDEIDRILADLAEEERLLAEADAALDKERQEYQRLVDLANDDFDKEQWDSARSNYEAALEVLPDEQFPKSRIKKIEEILADLANAETNALAKAEDDERDRIEREYQELIDRGNDLFNSEDYSDSKDQYVAALEIKPNEKYPKSRIQRIEEILEEMERLADQTAKDEEQARIDAEREAEEEARLAEEQLAEEERLRKLEEERQEAERLAEEERERQEELDRQRNLRNNSDASREDEVERYYREAKESEEAAKYNSIRKQKQKEEEFYAMLTDQNEDARNDKLDDLNNRRDELQKVYRNGFEMQSERRRLQNKLKEDLASEEVERSERFGYYRLENTEKAFMKKEALESISYNDGHRKGRIMSSEAKKAEQDSNLKSYEKKGRALASDRGYDTDRIKERDLDMKDRGNLYRLNGQERTTDKKEDFVNFQNDVRKANTERRSSSIDKKERDKVRQQDFLNDKSEEHLQDVREIDKKKDSQQSLNEKKNREYELRRDAKRMEAFTKNSSGKRNFDDYALPDGAEGLVEGVNETSYELPGKTVIERTVKIGNKVDVYRKVISKTGTYYFKNNQSITEHTWTRETLELRD